MLFKISKSSFVKIGTFIQNKIFTIINDKMINIEDIPLILLFFCNLIKIPDKKPNKCAIKSELLLKSLKITISKIIRLK